MLLGPAFDHYFLLGVELDGIAALAVQDAEEAVFPAAERKIGHGGGYADVDSDIAGGGFVPEPPCRRAARGKQRCLVAVATALEECQSFVHIAGMNQAQDWTEDFRIRHVAGRRHVVEDRRLNEISGLVFGDPWITSVQQNFRTLLFTCGDQRMNSRFALGRNYRSHLDAFVEAVAYAQVCR